MAGAAAAGTPAVDIAEVIQRGMERGAARTTACRDTHLQAGDSDRPISRRRARGEVPRASCTGFRGMAGRGCRDARSAAAMHHHSHHCPIAIHERN